MFPIVSVLFLAACGGSSSETPMPLEPLPHVGPEPTAAKQSTTPAESMKNSSQSSPVAPSQLNEPSVQPEQEEEPDDPSR